MLNIFVTNLGKYNEEKLIGEWLELPATEEEIQKTLENIGINEEYEKFFITDYESDIENLEIDEFQDIDELNEMAEAIGDFNYIEIKILDLFLKNYDIQEAIEEVKNHDYYVYEDCENMADVAYMIINESGLLDEMPEIVKIYFDYEAYGKDLEMERNFNQLDYDTYVELI